MITPAEFEDKMKKAKELAENGEKDIVDTHIFVVDCMADVLECLGYAKGVEIVDDINSMFEKSFSS